MFKGALREASKHKHSCYTRDTQPAASAAALVLQHGKQIPWTSIAQAEAPPNKQQAGKLRLNSTAQTYERPQARPVKGGLRPCPMCQAPLALEAFHTPSPTPLLAETPTTVRNNETAHALHRYTQHPCKCCLERPAQPQSFLSGALAESSTISCNSSSSSPNENLAAAPPVCC